MEPVINIIKVLFLNKIFKINSSGMPFALYQVSPVLA